MIARAAALEHRLPALNALSLGSRVFPGGTGAYGYGALFVDYLARTRGDSTIRHFIDAQSDPDYQEIVTKLERANRLLSNPTLDNVMVAEKALNRGRMYLKNAFPNDRLLGLLVTHLDYGLSQKRKIEPHAGDTSKQVPR